MRRSFLIAIVLLTAVALAPSCKKKPEGPKHDPHVLWFSVRYGLEEIGLVEIRRGKPPTLTAPGTDEPTTRLKTEFATIASPGGIAVKMHLPPEEGEGRGALGSVMFKPGEPGYASAVERKLEDAKFGVVRVKPYTEKPPPLSIVALQIFRSGEKVGTLNFGRGEPKLTIETPKADGLGLRSDWDHMSKRDELLVRYVSGKGPSATLVTKRAKKGDPEYRNVVRLFLEVEEPYEVKVIDR